MRSATSICASPPTGREVFERLGGFDPSHAYGEDHAFVWAARRAGVPVVAAGAPLYSSARKYAEHGWLRTTARHGWLTAVQAWREARRGSM
jgi:GT2 family glycosyltransferase